MMELQVLRMTEKKLGELKDQLLERSNVFTVKSDLEFSSWLISYGIAREVGTVNDELSRFLFDAPSGRSIPRESLRADVVSANGKVAVRIASVESSSLEVRIKGFRSLVHPALSENADGSYHQIVIFPEIAAKVAALEEIELVVLKHWALNSIFGGFRSTEEYYATNFWELETNDSTLFADLLQKRQLAFLGTHDLIAHIAGLTKAAWTDLPRYAKKVSEAIQESLGEAPALIPDLVLPYTAGVILDDLAQPPSYQSQSHIIMLEEVLKALPVKRGDSRKRMLLKYPAAFEQVIRLSRKPGLNRMSAREAVQGLVRELKQFTIQVA